MTSLLDGEWIACAATCFAGAARGTSSSEEPDLAGLRLCGRDLGAGFFDEDGGGGLDLVVFERLALATRQN